MDDLTALVSQEIDQLVRDGRLIDAIKLLLRHDHNLREAKDRVTQVQLDIDLAAFEAREKWLNSVERELGVSYK